MKSAAILTFLLIIQTNEFAFSQIKLVKEKPNEMCWWYKLPATKYWEGLPIGTGRFAAMVLGKTEDEVIPFNDETLWTGGPYNPNNPNGPEVLKNIREYAFKKDWINAKKESVKLGSDPERVQLYQPMGRLNLKFEGHEQAADYCRKLSMDSALVNIHYNANGIVYKREVFASFPDQVIVLRLSSSAKGSISFTTWLSSLQPSAVMHIEDNDIIMGGTTTDNTLNPYKFRILPSEMKWQSRLRVIPVGGTITITDTTIQVNNADYVTLILAGGTNWKSWNDVSGNEKMKCNQYIENAAKYTYNQLKDRHLKDYCPLFASCKLDLGTSNNAKLSTTERMELLRKGEDDPLYISQYFQFGRYLLLAAARESTLAFNNHNIWLDNMEGRWRGRWTLNINIQECYWPVENTNLSNVNESLFWFVENLAQSGARTAKELYGCRGWTAHHGTDIWFNTAPTDGDPHHATWPMSGAWLMQQLFDHYLYDPNPIYLAKIYPLLKGAAEFMNDFLVKDNETGYWVTCPSTSPENVVRISDAKPPEGLNGVFVASTMDIALIRNLFRNCITSCKTLKRDEDFCKSLEEKLSKLPPYQVGKFGQLQEWLYDFDEFEVTHRHLSHLYGAYPDDDITPRKTPELADAARVVLQRRGDINKGWSGAWKINLYARLEEPQQAYDIMNNMLTDISIHPAEEDSQITPSFEGNQGIQGVTAGIAEMLLQSHSGEISLLPALPKQLDKGSVHGLRAKGGYTIDIKWGNGKLQSAGLYSKYNSICKIRTKSSIVVLLNEKPINIISTDKNLVQFQASEGMYYTILSK